MSRWITTMELDAPVTSAASRSMRPGLTRPVTWAFAAPITVAFDSATMPAAAIIAANVSRIQKRLRRYPRSGPEHNRVAHILMSLWFVEKAPMIMVNASAITRVSRLDVSRLLGAAAA